jgi:3-oxoacyl-[acyl-carrier protein] reductase
MSRRLTPAGAYVTGAGSGMGLAIARLLDTEGIPVTGVDRNPPPDDWPSDATFLVGDLIDDDFVDRSVADVADLGYVVNAAGITLIGADGPLPSLTWEAWQQTLAVNLRAPARVARAAVPSLIKRGHGAMVHISSLAAVGNMTAPFDAYTASKAGLVALSRSLALQLAPHGVRSNTILPGPIRTPMLGLQGDERAADIEARVPLGRLGSPDEIAGACVFLLSDDASYITGVDLAVDGGMRVRA